LGAAARQPMTWWQRMVVMGAALAVAGFMYGDLGMVLNPSRLGREMFMVLSGFALASGLLAGPLVAADCLGRERREGTLGLLFLTPLRSFDVVFGKLAAASLTMVLGILAGFPVLAITLLLGGVSSSQFVHVVLGVLALLFLSLAVATCASSVFASSRASLAATLIVLGALTFGLPWVGIGLWTVSLTHQYAPFLYGWSPFYTILLCVNPFFRTPAWSFWTSLAALQALSWACLGLACWRTTRSWRGPPESAFARRWRERWARWRQGGAGARRGWRRSMLERNPFSWLEGRDRLEQAALWGLLLASMGFWAWEYRRSPRGWMEEEVVIIWSFVAHHLLCLWIAVQAPRRLADDKQSGALELLLCTALAPAEIVRGGMWSLWRRFGRALAALLALDTALVCVFLIERTGWVTWAEWHTNYLFRLGLCGAIVLPLQGYTLARVGLYQGLAQGHSLRATFLVIWQAGLLPWLLFGAALLGCEFARRQFRLRWRLDDTSVLNLWAAVHVLVCGLLLAYASWQLHRNFRALAAQTPQPGRWKRWLRWVGLPA
jgi:ABC-type transport system involved in multi-copper enzyme maturation permease subunit